MRGLHPNTPIGVAVPILYDPVSGEALVLDAVPMLKVSTDGELVVPRGLVLRGRVLATLGGFTLFFFLLLTGLSILLLSR